MSQTLDVYRDWLRIPEADRPLSHYQLLRVKKFEDDTNKIRENYRKMNAFVRKFAAGEFAKQSQDLLNELAKAMLCLTDKQRKGEYDSSLGRKDTGGVKARGFEQILLTTKVIDEAALNKARNFAKAIGVEVKDALVQQKLAKPEAILPAYAESIGLPFLDLADVPLNLALIRKVPPNIARTHSCVPVLVDNGEILMASPNPIDPNVEEELRLRFGMPVRTVLCTPANINDVIANHVPRDGGAVDETPVAAPSMTAGAGSQPTAAAAPAAPEKVASSGPMTDEEKKERRNLAFVAFNMAVMGTMGLLYSVLHRGFLLSFAVTLVVAPLVGYIAWKVKSR